MRAENRQALAASTLQQLNEATGKLDLVRELLLIFKKYTEFEAVGIRLRDGEDYPYYTTDGFSDGFVEGERHLCARCPDGEILREDDGRPVLECMCGTVIRSRTDPEQPFFTARGSFWTNSTTSLLDNTTTDPRQGRTRNRCNADGYETVVLIPLVSKEETVGLLQLNDRRQSRITREDVDFLESIGSSIGVALARRSNEERIRVSEETFRTMFESMPASILLLDGERRVMNINRTFEEQFATSKDRAIGRRDAEVLGCVPYLEDPQSCRAGTCEACGIWKSTCSALSGDRARRVRAVIETKHGRKPGKKVFMVSSAPIDIRGDRAAILMLEDITELETLRTRLRVEHSFAGIIGRDEKMCQVFDAIRDVANASVPVHISGESGTGKELVASAIHNEGHRKDGPFVPVNCAALPEGLLESELFGHVRGAFTGAIRDKKGRYQLSHGGTIFLDEIADIPPHIQVKLLRVLQEGRFEPLGSEKTIKADVRVISATNKDLRTEVAGGRFREDLFYRLCVIPVHLPALRERKSDIPLLAQELLKRALEELGRESDVELSAEVVDLFIDLDWPGNVRELQNAIQYALVKCREGTIGLQHILPDLLRRSGLPPARGAPTPLGRRKLDSESVLQALERSGGNKVAAAKHLGVGRATLYRFLTDTDFIKKT